MTDVATLIDWLRAQQVRDLHLDSRALRAGDAFVALPGAQADGRNYLAAAVRQGASALLVEAEGLARAEVDVRDVPLRAVQGLGGLLGELGAAFYGRPSERLQSIGVTGTNGKTSCSSWIAQALTLAGTRCGVVGTVGSGFPGALDRAASLTTPDPLSLQREVKRLAAAGARALAMEVSSIGLDQGRVAGMKFDVAVFTNLTRDHLDYHGTMAAYEAAKARLFDWPTLTHAVVNLDDPMGARLAQALAARGAPRVIGYTLQQAAAPAGVSVLCADALRATAQGLGFVLRADGQALPVEVALVGQFNAANLLAVTGALLGCGLSLERIVPLLPQLTPPPGRMQRVGSGRGAPLAVVDYAHTPDALAQALAALRPVAQARGGRLWAVFGAGGDRDPGKRAPMGAAAAAADRIVITSDNPRSEPPAVIVDMVAAGVPAGRGCERIVERAEAIAFALARAAAADVVLIAGKGHEDYQDAGGHKVHFSDVEQAAAALAARPGSYQPLPPPTPASALERRSGEPQHPQIPPPTPALREGGGGAQGAPAPDGAKAVPGAKGEPGAKGRTC